jgi:hypothetical protein
MDRLFIEGKEVELSANTIISLSLQINDLGDLVDRQANYTNQFKLPVTGHNREVLKNSELLNITSRLPYKKLAAKVYKDGLEVISDGYAIIDSYNGEYNVTVYGGLIDFFKLLEGKNLRDLDLSQYVHSYTPTTAVNSFANTQGYIYALVKNGAGNVSMTGSDDIIHNRTLPWFYIHSIVKAIIEGVGFTQIGSILNDTKYLKSVIQLADDRWVTTGKILHAEVDGNQGGNSPNNNPYINLFVDFNDDFSGNVTNQTGCFDVSNILNPNTDLVFPATYSVPAEVKVKYSIKYSIYHNDPAGGFVRVRLYRNASSVYVINVPNIPPLVTLTGVIDAELPNGIYNVGDVITCEVMFNSNNPSSTRRSTFYILSGSYVDFELVTAPVILGSYIHPQMSLPDWSQADFLKSVAHIFGLIYKPNSNLKQLKIESLETIVKNLPYALDWTDKMHMEVNKDGIPNYNANYKLGKFGQRNWLKYTHDDNVTPNLGDGYFDIDNNHLTPEVTLLQTDFGASDSEDINSWANYVMYIERFDVNGLLSDSIAPRIGIVDTINLPTQFRWYENSTLAAWSTFQNNVALVRFINPLYSTNMGYDNTLIQDYYSLYQRVTISPVTLTIKAKLSQYDIANLDHFIPIYLRQFASYFYINKVSNYQSHTKLTSVELIKINAYTSAPTPNAIVGLNIEVICNGRFNNPDPNDVNNPHMKCWDGAEYQRWDSLYPLFGSMMNYQSVSDYIINQAWPNPIYANGIYKVSFDISGFTNGTIDCYITDSGFGTTYWTIPSGSIINGNNFAIFTFNGNEGGIVFDAQGSFDGVLDNVSVMRIG